MVHWKQKAPVLVQIAEFIGSPTHRIDKTTLHQARRVAADTIGVSFSGVKSDAFRRALKQKSNMYGTGNFTVWGANQKTTLLGAVFYNTLSVSSTDFDEGHRKSVGHPASSIVPAAFALGKLLNSTYEQVLQSIIVGYEVATRFSYARKPENINTYSSGRWGATGTAATAAYLLKLNVGQTMYALSNAWILSPVMLGGSTDVRTGSMSKEGVAWAAQAGLQSALLAEKHFAGPYSFIDDHDDIDGSKLLDGLGESWLINSNYFKPYACCRWLHAAAQAAENIREKYTFLPEDIRNIEIMTFGRAIQLVDEKFPQNSVQAQFHLPYVVACMLVNGQVQPEHFSEKKLQDRQMKKTANKILLTEVKEYTAVFPGQLPSSVVVTTVDNTFKEEILTAPWDAGCPPTDAQLKDKFLLQSGKENNPLWNKLLHKEISNKTEINLF